MFDTVDHTAKEKILPLVAKEGQRYTSFEMSKLKLPEGKWFINVAPLGSKPSWTVQDSPTAGKR